MSEKKLEQVVDQMMKGHKNEKAVREYIAWVQSLEHKVKFCAKCRRRGCEKCEYVHCLRYVVRHQRPAYWWRTSSQAAVMGTVRFLSSV